MFWLSVRKLAREAVILMLLGWILLTAGMFVYFHAAIPTEVPTVVKAAPAPQQPSKPDPLDALGGIPATTAPSPARPTDAKTAQPATTRDDFFSAYKSAVPATSEKPTAAQPISQTCREFSSSGNCSNLDFFETSLWIGLFGFPAGLGVWIFYRIVRFAIKG